MPENEEKIELSQEIDDLLDDIDVSTSTEEETDLDIKSDEEVEKLEEEGGEDVVEELEEDKEDEGAEEVAEEVGEEVEDEAEEKAEVIAGGEQETEEEPLSLEDQNKMLLERIEVLSKATPAVAPTEEEVVEEIVAGFIGEEEDIDDIVSDRGKLNELLVKVSQATEASTTKKILQSIPQMIVRQVQQHKVINDAVDEFYTENKDLEVVKGTVGKVANEVSAEHPDWTLEKVFTETGTRTRKLLGMKTSAVQKKKRNPKIIKRTSSGGRQQLEKTDLTELEKDVNELL